MGLDSPPRLCIDRISIMRYPHISKLDLDLLVHLAVLLEERHVTRAANRCFLSQSAMSRQLERLREAWATSCFCAPADCTKGLPEASSFFGNLSPCCRALREFCKDTRSIRRKAKISFK